MAGSTPGKPDDTLPEPVPEVVTDADVAAAEAAATEAQALVTELEEKVLNGDDTVTPDEIVAQESLGRFARLRAESTRRKAVKSKEAARLRACEALYADIDTYASGEGKRFGPMFQAIYDAKAAFKTAVEERNAEVRTWRQRAEALEVAVDDGRPTPRASDGRVALGGGAALVRADGRIFYTIDAKTYLDALDGTPEDVASVVKNLNEIDIPDPQVQPTYIYRGPAGAIVARDRPYTDDELAYLPVKRITAKEAWPE